MGFSQIRDFCEVVKEVAENEAKLASYKGKEKEKLWVGRNFESNLKIPSSVYCVVNESVSTAFVACMYEGTDGKESEKAYDAMKLKLENCLGVSYKISISNKQLSNGDAVREVTFKQVGYKNKVQTIVLQYSRPAQADKKNKIRVMLIFPLNGFYM